MTKGERLSSRGSGAVMLPVFGEVVKFRIPRSRGLIEAALFPLRFSIVDTSEMEQFEIDALYEDAERVAERTICAACYDPMFIEGEPRPGRNESCVKDLSPDDFAILNKAITDKIQEMYTCTDQEPTTQPEADALKSVAIACRMFAKDPTEVEEWDPDRLERLIVYAKLVADGN